MLEKNSVPQISSKDGATQTLEEIKLILLRGRLFLISSVSGFLLFSLEVIEFYNEGSYLISSRVINVLSIIFITVFAGCISLAIGTVFIQFWEYEKLNNDISSKNLEKTTNDNSLEL